MFPSRRVILAGGGIFRDEASLTFAGTNDYIDLGDVAIFEFDGSSPANHTIVAWIKATGSDSNNSIMSKYTSTSGDEGWLFSLVAGKLNLQLYGDDSVQNLSTGADLRDDTWHHVAAVTTGTTSTEIYIDGVSEKTVTATWTPDVSAAGNVEIGAKATANPFNGKISEVAYYNTKLYDGEIPQLYNGGEAYNHAEGLRLAYLKGWWRMGDGLENSSGTTIYDMSKNSNNGTMTNFPAGVFTGDTP